MSDVEDIVTQLKSKTIFNIFPEDDDFQFIGHIIHISDDIIREDGTTFKRILLRDDTALIYAFLYHDHQLGPDKLELLQVKTHVRIAIPESRCIGYNPSNSVGKCRPEFCANCHPNRAVIVLRDGYEIDGVTTTTTTITSQLNIHIPFKFSTFQEIQQLKYGDVVDVLCVVKQIHWVKDEDAEGIWAWGQEGDPLPVRQMEITNIFPHNDPNSNRDRITLRCAVWGKQWRKLDMVGGILALKGAKIDKGWQNQKGLNIGNTCEIFNINGDDEMWQIPDGEMEEFYWNLFPKLEEIPPTIVEENGCSSRPCKIPKIEEVDLAIENVIYLPNTNGNARNERRRRVVDFTRDTDPLIINVKKSREFMDIIGKYREGVYSMRSNPRGMLLLINNLYFEQRTTERERKGSFHDERYIVNLFKQMGFSSDIQANVRLEEFASVIARFKSRILINPVDCIAVVLMSHGQQNLITMVDEQHINLWSDVVYKFSDEDCPALIGKPKLFISQYCQEFQGIVGNQNLEVTRSMKDTIVCLPTLPGTSALRDEVLGSHFIYCLSKVMMENAHEMDLVQMLHEVQTMFSDEIILDEGDNRQCYWIQLGFRKLLFFNPGI